MDRLPLSTSPAHTKTVRLVARQLEAMRNAGIAVNAVVVHHDVDRSSLAHRRAEIEKWFDDGTLCKQGFSLVICTPDPCLERWLCMCEGTQTRVKGGKPGAGCDPWKALWNKGKGIPLDRVRDAASRARVALRGQPDFDRFYEDWKSAGLEKGQS